ncbi:MAG: hypothetical protein WAO98_05445 [Alphaproteobacteria bacterium]
MKYILRSFLVLFLSVISIVDAYASDNVLFPTTATIPQGFKLLFSGPSNGGYYLQYNGGSDGLGRVMISEQLETKDYNYAKTLENYNLSIKNQGAIKTEKIKDINYQGMPGVLFHSVDTGRHSYRIFLKDNNKLFSFLVSDASDIKFTAEKAESLLNTFVRQAADKNIETPTGMPEKSAPPLPDKVSNDAKEQLALLKAIKESSSKENEKIATWIIQHQSELIPLYLLELSQRLLAKNMDEAFEWYTIGIMRGRYDAKRCVRPNPGSEALGLNAIATMQYIKLKIDAFAAAGQRTVERGDLFKYNAPIDWICDDFSFDSTKDVALKPQTEWPALAEEVRQQSRAKYKNAAKPAQPDLTSISVATYELPEGTSWTDMAWLNDENLVIELPSKERRQVGKNADLYFWNVKTQKATYAVPYAGLWCASDNNFTYTTSRNGSGTNYSFTMMNQTTTGNKTFTTGNLAAGLSWGQHIPRGISGHNPEMYKAAEKFNPFDCTWTTSKEYAALYPSFAWEFLRQGDGVIAFQPTNGDKKALGPKMTAVHYNAAGTPIQLPIAAQGLDINSVRYYAFRNAYFLTVPFIKQVQNDVGNCLSAWWLDAKTSNVDQVCAPSELDGQEAAYAPTRKGILRFLSLRNDGRHKVEGGVYLTDNNGHTNKIWSGMASGGAVSPNGCLVAVSALKPVVLNLCGQN